MTIENNTVVSLHYKLSNHTTGEKIEETSANHPMEFLYGVERVIPQFEEGIFGKTAGDTFELVISSENAYGTADPERVVHLPINIFHDDNGQLDTDVIKAGAILPMSDSDGNQLRGHVLEVDTEKVKMDFNHPLAGIDLRFEGEILSVRAATPDEISHGHSHGEHGHQH